MGQRESFVLLGVLRVKYFDMSKWEEPFSTIDFSFPLTVYVHPCNLHNVSNLQNRTKAVITHGNLTSDTNQMKRGKNKHKPIIRGEESHSLLGIRFSWKVTFTSLKYQHFAATHHCVWVLFQTLNVYSHIQTNYWTTPFPIGKLQLHATIYLA